MKKSIFFSKSFVKALSIMTFVLFGALGIQAQCGLNFPPLKEANEAVSVIGQKLGELKVEYTANPSAYVEQKLNFWSGIHTSLLNGETTKSAICSNAAFNDPSSDVKVTSAKTMVTLNLGKQDQITLMNETISILKL